MFREAVSCDAIASIVSYGAVDVFDPDTCEKLAIRIAEVADLEKRTGDNVRTITHRFQENCCHYLNDNNRSTMLRKKYILMIRKRTISQRNSILTSSFKSSSY